MQGKDPGFNRENIVVIDNLTTGITDNYNSLKEELLRLPGITGVTASEGIPGDQATVQNSWPAEGGSRDNAIMMYENRVQDDYFETFQIQLMEGRTFSSDIETDKSAFVINRSAARALGLDDPIGKDIYLFETRGTIIGVVNDFHFESLHEPIKPMAHSRYSSRFRFISIRIVPGDMIRTIEAAGKIMNSFDPDYVFNYNFLDTRLKKIYETEERNTWLISMSAILSVIISVMGLYSLTSFTITRRIKEIGIRKALGSSTFSLLLVIQGYGSVGIAFQSDSMAGSMVPDEQMAGKFCLPYRTGFMDVRCFGCHCPCSCHVNYYRTGNQGSQHQSCSCSQV
jgi:putative ABC transport system permease protein